MILGNVMENEIANSRIRGKYNVFRHVTVTHDKNTHIFVCCARTSLYHSTSQNTTHTSGALAWPGSATLAWLESAGGLVTTIAITRPSHGTLGLCVCKWRKAWNRGRHRSLNWGRCRGGARFICVWFNASRSRRCRLLMWSGLNALQNKQLRVDGNCI